MWCSIQKSSGYFGLAVLALSLCFCRFSGDEPRGFDPYFADFITSYTSGLIPSGSPIRIILSEKLADSTRTGQMGANQLIRLTPSIEGTARWIDSRTLEFQPEERLKSGQRYEVALSLNKISELVGKEEIFVFPVQVIQQDYEFILEQTRTPDINNLAVQELAGYVITADFAESAMMEKMLQVTQESSELSVEWTHSTDGLQHRYTVRDVVRKDNPGKVLFQMEGASIDADRSQKVEIEIPSLKEFRLTNIRVINGGNQHLILQFSDPLQEDQDLRGLVRLGLQQDLSFSIRDHEIKIFPNVRQTDSLELILDTGIRNVLGKRLDSETLQWVRFAQFKPEVRFAGRGNILPGDGQLKLPFEAVGLNAVDVEVIKIYEQNIFQFLQANQLDGSNELRRVGKPILRKTLSLNEAGITDTEKWNRYSLDLTTLLRPEPGALYQVRLDFKRAYSTYYCDGQPFALAESIKPEEEDWEEAESREFSYWDSYEYYSYDADYDWQERDNPCHNSFYSGKRISRNILASDLGIICKSNRDQTLEVHLTSITTTQPLSQAQVEVYDFQKQLLATATTDGEGKSVLQVEGKPFMLIARWGPHRNYVRLDEGSSLSVSSFDVSGSEVQKGIKGFIYGERGVWRPGDSLHLAFMMEDKQKSLPQGHPIIFELLDPRRSTVNRQVKQITGDPIYYFGTSTTPDAATGNYLAKIKVGGAEFTQSVMVETVKPNRLKIQLDLEKDKILPGPENIKGNLQVNWLHGAPGSGLLAEFDMLLTRGVPDFPRYKDYSFEDPTVSFQAEPIALLSKKLDSEGKTAVSYTLENLWNPPSTLQVTFRGKVFEPGGDFSIDRFTVPYLPYPAMLGIRTPKGDVARGMLLTDTSHLLEIVRLTPEGQLQGDHTVNLEIYKIGWNWWWQNDDGQLANFMSSDQAIPLEKQNLRLRAGKASYTFRVNYPDWGRYLVRICDPLGGHCTGKVVFVDWPGWAGRAQREGQEGATMLMLTSDKTSYQSGDEAELTIPGSSAGRALISIENGTKVLKSWWISTQSGDNRVRFEVTDDMTPNIYAHIILLQEHAQTANDQPIRLYGIIPMSVIDPKTRLEPVIKLPSVLQPGKEVSIQVSEKEGREMFYSVAVVDEGLLDLTRFQTPDPWKKFYAREALGTRTWDMYDQVMGAYGAQMDRLLALGGDEAVLNPKDGDSRATRFKPVVKFMGPFKLSKGKTGMHRFVMPSYIGSVRAMIVAADRGAYGHAEVSVPVKQPLMVLATAPRVLGLEETFTLPVTVFREEKSIRSASVSINTDGPLSLADNRTSQRFDFGEMDEATIYFQLKTNSVSGIGRIRIEASSGNQKAEHVIELGIRNPILPEIRIQDGVVESGKKWSEALQLFGIPGSNECVLEVSVIPPINLESHLNYLLTYPHGCLEQITSMAFPQLYVGQFRDLNATETQKIQSQIRHAINQISRLQHADGGFAYWPGATASDTWSTSYAGQFLLEAEKKGFVVSTEVLRRWKKFQKDQVNAYRRKKTVRGDALDQAYRLYVLALGGSVEQAAMNRLRETPDLENETAYMLASSYALAGQKDISRQIISRMQGATLSYEQPGITFGSEWRDKAIMLETVYLLDDRSAMLELFREVAGKLGKSGDWLSTQSTAFCIRALALCLSAVQTSKELLASYTLDARGSKEIRTGLPIARVSLDVKDNKSLQIENKSTGPLFIRVFTKGIPERGQEADLENNLKIKITYKDSDGKIMDVKFLTRGSSFTQEVEVQYTGKYQTSENLALTQIFPTGWEIHNERLNMVTDFQQDKFKYQDIRDDRVLTYFRIQPGETKKFVTRLTATYSGQFYVPGVVCEDMYDASVLAKKSGYFSEVGGDEPSL